MDQIRQDTNCKSSRQEKTQMAVWKSVEKTIIKQKDILPCSCKIEWGNLYAVMEWQWRYTFRYKGVCSKLIFL